jgi:hypothetical protein
MKEISLTHGLVALVDDADYDYLMQWKWHATKAKQTYYAGRGITRGKDKVYIHKVFLMHREIMKCPDDMQIDHIDGNGLNNQRSNLRICTNLQNCWNMSKRSKICDYKGIYLRQNGKYRAYIKANGRRVNLGTYVEQEDGARAYDIGALYFFKEFSKTNFPKDDYKDLDIDYEFEMLMRKKDIPWNLGKTKDNDASIARMSKSRKGYTAWNKGLTIEDPRVLQGVEKRWGCRR